MAAPKGIPKDVETLLLAAIKKVYDSKDTRTSWPAADTA